MNVNFTFKNLDSSQDTISYASKKIHKLLKFRDLKITETKFIFTNEKSNIVYNTEIIIKAKNLTISAKGYGKNLRISTDDALDKALKQLAKKKTMVTK